MKLMSSVFLSAVALSTCCSSAMAQHVHSQPAQQGTVIGEHHCQSGQCDDGSCQCCLSRIRLYPDAGWNPPVHYPVNHDWAWYNNAWPNAFYGNPGGGFTAQYPVVAQPTDTTQLGYYYHKVPTWQPRPDMIPPVPNPSMFHSRNCTTCGNGTFHRMHMAAAETTVPATQKIQTAAAKPATKSVRPAAASGKARPSVRPVKSTGFRLPNLLD